MTQSCPVHALPGVETGPSASTDPSEPALTKNQKQKRRQKLSKRGRNQQQSADSTCASGLTDLGDCWSKRFRSAVPDSSNNSGDSEASATLAAASSLSRPLEVSGKSLEVQSAGVCIVMAAPLVWSGRHVQAQIWQLSCLAYVLRPGTSHTTQAFAERTPGRPSEILLWWRCAFQRSCIQRG